MGILNFTIGMGCMALLTASSMAAEYDLIIRNGAVYDGSGGAPIIGDLAIKGDAISAVGPLEKSARARKEVNAEGLAVAPGFINMLSWATESLIEDGRSQGDIRQGVTLEIFGEGESMGPLNALMKKDKHVCPMGRYVADMSAQHVIGVRQGQIEPARLRQPHPFVWRVVGQPGTNPQRQTRRLQIPNLLCEQR